MIDVSIVKRMRVQSANELHTQLCAKIEKAIINTAMDGFNELLVQLPSEIQNPHLASIRLETYAYDIERLQFTLKNAGYEIDTTVYKNSFVIKW